MEIFSQPWTMEIIWFLYYSVVVLGMLVVASTYDLFIRFISWRLGGNVNCFKTKKNTTYFLATYIQCYDFYYQHFSEWINLKTLLSLWNSFLIHELKLNFRKTLILLSILGKTTYILENSFDGNLISKHFFSRTF